MIQTLVLSPGITLRYYRDSRFKQSCLSFQLVRPMQVSEAAMNAILPAILLRGTQKRPDLRAITWHLDDLYGASIGAQVRRVGDYQTTGLYCSFMDDRFVMDGDAILAPMVDFLREILLEPLVEDGGFCPEFVQSEKKNLISTIESELNDKRAYAGAKLLKIMCKADSFGVPRLGSLKSVEDIQPITLYNHYRRILAESPIELFYVGSAPIETVAQLLQNIFSALDRQPVPPAQQTPFQDVGGEHLSESMQIAQSKLSMGFVTSITNQSKDFAAMQLLNTIFGAGMTSKLFLNVREKLSLCYSIHSGYYGSKGIVTVAAGIDAQQEQTVRAEIMRQLDACKSGDITQEELAAAQQALFSSLETVHDAPGAIEGYYSTGALSCMHMTPEEYQAAILSTTVDDVVRVANTVQLHSSFFLKGVGI